MANDESNTPKQISVHDLKDCLDALEKLKAIRRELKARLSKEGLTDQDEVSFAQHLTQASTQIEKLEKLKLRPVTIPGLDLLAESGGGGPSTPNPPSESPGQPSGSSGRGDNPPPAPPPAAPPKK